MNINDLSKLVSERTGEPAYKTKKIIKCFITIIREQIIKAQIIKLRDLLTFFIDVAPEKNIYNVYTQKYETLPRRFLLKIIPSNILKKQISEKKTY